MTFNSHVTGPHSRRLTTLFAMLSRSAANTSWTLKRFGSKFMETARTALKGIQLGRMMSILSNMSDTQLAELGLARADIPQYAEKLLANE